MVLIAAGFAAEWKQNPIVNPLGMISTSPPRLRWSSTPSLVTQRLPDGIVPAVGRLPAVACEEFALPVSSVHAPAAYVDPYSRTRLAPKMVEGSSTGGLSSTHCGTPAMHLKVASEPA